MKHSQSREILKHDVKTKGYNREPIKRGRHAGTSDRHNIGQLQRGSCVLDMAGAVYIYILITTYDVEHWSVRKKHENDLECQHRVWSQANMIASFLLNCSLQNDLLGKYLGDHVPRLADL